MTTLVTIGKTGDNHEIDFAALPAASQAYVIAYGLKQALNDCHASIQRNGKDEDGDALYASDTDFQRAVRDAVDARLSALMEGTIGIRSSGTRLDPLSAEIVRLARAEVVKAVRAKGIKVKTVGKDKMAELVANHAAKASKRLTATAKENLAKLSEAPEAEIDLSDLA